MIGAILVTGASLTASLFVVQVAVIPLLFKYSKAVQRKMVFSNCINYPRNLDYDNPSSCNVVGGRNFQIEFESQVDKCPIKIGVWHIVPCSMFHSVFVVRDYIRLEERLHQELGRTRNTVVLYCHGNSNHRASPHRLQMYKVFQELNFHIITFDYRGYGDSTRVRPTERGVVEDTFHVYAWLIDSLSKTNKPTVLLWGHSLGTAVIANLSAHLEELCTQTDKRVPPPDALVLEAPFNNLADEIERHPFSKLVSWLPYYKETFIKPFSASTEYSFTTDRYLASTPHVPVLILHSKADKIVPYDLAVKVSILTEESLKKRIDILLGSHLNTDSVLANLATLHETMAETRSKVADPAPLVLHSFEKTTGVGHNNICECPQIPTIVNEFVQLLKKD